MPRYAQPARSRRGRPSFDPTQITAVYVCDFEGCDGGPNAIGPYYTDRSSDLQRHRKRHDPNCEFKCTSLGCLFETRQRSNLKTHMLTHSTKEKSIGCDQCDKKFKSSSSKTRHWKEKHGLCGVQGCTIRETNLQDLNMHRAQYHEIQTPIPPQPASLLNIQAPPSVNSPHASTPSTDWSSVATPPSVMLEVYPQLPAHAASVTHCIPLSTASPAIEYPSPSASPYVDMHAAKEPHSFQSNLASYVQYHGHAAMFPTHGSDTPPSTPSVPEAGGAEIGMGFLNPLDNSIPVSPSQNFAEPSGQDQVVSTRLPEYTATGASGYGASNMLVWTEIFRENLLLDGQSRVSSPFQASANMMYQHELASDSFAHNSHQPGTAYTPQCNHIPQSDLEPLPPTPRGSSQQHAQPRVVAGNAFWPAFTMTPPTSTLPYPF